MAVQKITILFDTEKPLDRKILKAVMNLPKHYQESSLSKALIKFLDQISIEHNEILVLNEQLQTSIEECQQRNQRCIHALASATGMTLGKATEFAINSFLNQKPRSNRANH